MIEPCFIGLDLGTSGCRAVAIDEQGQQLAAHRVALPLPLTAGPGQSEQQPELWWQACVTVLQRLTQELRHLPRAIAVDGTSGSLLLCDANQGTPLSNALMYNDQRATAELAQLRHIAPPSAAVHSASASLPKLLHLLAKSAGGKLRALHQAEWISGRLSGSFTTGDENNCLKLGYDPLARCWPNWMQALQLPAGILPHIVPAGAQLATLDSKVAALTGLPVDCLLIAGTTDSIAATLAAGISQPGEAVTSLGSTLVLKILAHQPVFSADHGVYSHRIFDYWLAGGASNSGGRVLRQFFSQQEIAQLTPKLQPRSPTGLDYYPLPATGERFPINDATLQPRITPVPQDRLRFFQALLEGMARIEQAGYSCLRELGAPAPTHIYSCGGGSGNPGWSVIRQAICGVPVSVADHTEAAYGSALLARRGVADNSY